MASETSSQEQLAHSISISNPNVQSDEEAFESNSHSQPDEDQEIPWGRSLGRGAPIRDALGTRRPTIRRGRQLTHARITRSVDKAEEIPPNATGLRSIVFGSLDVDQETAEQSSPPPIEDTDSGIESERYGISDEESEDPTTHNAPELDTGVSTDVQPTSLSTEHQSESVSIDKSQMQMLPSCWSWELDTNGKPIFICSLIPEWLVLSKIHPLSDEFVDLPKRKTTAVVGKLPSGWTGVIHPSGQVRYFNVSPTFDEGYLSSTFSMLGFIKDHESPVDPRTGRLSIPKRIWRQHQKLSLIKHLAADVFKYKNTPAPCQEPVRISRGMQTDSFEDTAVTTVAAVPVPCYEPPESDNELCDDCPESGTSFRSEEFHTDPCETLEPSSPLDQSHLDTEHSIGIVTTDASMLSDHPSEGVILHHTELDSSSQIETPTHHSPAADDSVDLPQSDDDLPSSPEQFSSQEVGLGSDIQAESSGARLDSDHQSHSVEIHDTPEVGTSETCPSPYIPDSPAKQVTPTEVGDMSTLDHAADAVELNSCEREYLKQCNSWAQVCWPCCNILGTDVLLCPRCGNQTWVLHHLNYERLIHLPNSPWKDRKLLEECLTIMGCPYLKEYTWAVFKEDHEETGLVDWSDDI